MKKTKRIIPAAVLALMMVLAVMCFSGCIDANYSTNVTKLQDMGYTVNTLESNANVAGGSTVVDAWKNQGAADQDYVRLYYFTTEDYAINYYYNTFLSYAVPELEKNNPDLAGQLEHRLVRNIVIFGTSGGVEDALS